MGTFPSALADAQWMNTCLGPPTRRRKSTDSAIRFRLLHYLPGFVAFARDHLILQRLPFFVLHPQWPAVGRHQLNLQLAITAVLLRIRRMIGNGVLIADGLRDIAKDLRQLALKAREVCLA